MVAVTEAPVADHEVAGSKPVENRKITGLVRVEDRKKGRVWVAAYMQRNGIKARKTLGMAWVRDGGARTARGAVVWRTRSGPKPSDEYLTPREAAAALETLLEIERDLPMPAAPRSRQKTVEDIVAAWLLHSSRVKGVAPSTFQSYQSIGRAIRRTLGEQTKLRELTVKALKDSQQEMLDAGRARSTIHHHFTALGHALDLAVEAGWIPQNPLDGVSIVPLPKVEPDFNVLEPTQVERVAVAIATVPESELPRMRDGEIWEDVAAKVRFTRSLWSEIVRLAAYTGLRMGELRALRWSDIDWRGTALRVARNAPASAPRDADPRAPKSGVARSVPLIPQAIACLKRTATLGHSAEPNDLVFPSLGGGLFDAGRVRAAFYDGLKAAGLGHLREKSNPMTFHDLRHTFGTIAARVFPLADVQAYFGHADIGTTMRYTHHVPRNDAAKKLAEAFSSDLLRAR